MMRSEQTMYHLILSFARDDCNIRAVYMNGSRANQKIPKDKLQDFDIVFVVKQIEPYLSSHLWISYFGDIAVMQEPDQSAIFHDSTPDGQHTFLMQFDDGNRIDLIVRTIHRALEEYGTDKLTVPLLDKDHLLPPIPIPSDEDYYVNKPSLPEYLSCCNEFWWVSTYIAKGLWRKELLYAMDQLNHYVRPMLMKMLNWYAGIDSSFQINTGKCSKYLKQYLPASVWQALLDTYPRAGTEEMWNSLLIMVDLFDKAAVYVGDKLGYLYDLKESHNTKKYLQLVKQLPKGDVD